MPPEATDRGVYVYEPAAGDEVTPGSLLAPVLGGLLDEAALVVETGAPPLTLLAGISSDAPAPAVKVGDVVLLGAPGDVAAAQARLADDAAPEGLLARLASAGAPVGWAGPLPGGDVLLEADAERVVVRATGADAGAVTRALAEQAPPNSPGKPWRELLVRPSVEAVGDEVVVTATRGDLPGVLLRQLIDTRSLTFLAPG